MSSREPGAIDEPRLHTQRRELLGALKTVNAELSDLEWSLAELEQQIRTLSAELGGEHSAAVERRLRDLRRWRDYMEERALRYMYRAEELNAALAAVGGA